MSELPSHPLEVWPQSLERPKRSTLEVLEDENVGTILLVRRTQRARTTHTCTDCGHDIEPGTLYDYIWSVVDGSGHVQRSHLACYDD